MVSHRNKKLLLEKSGQKIHKFGLKKLKVGVVSVAITAGILVSYNTLPQVNAEELVDENAVELVTDEVAEELPEVESPTEASVEEGIVEEKPSEESTVELVSDAAVEELPEVESPTEAPIEEGIVEEEPSQESTVELVSDAAVEELPEVESPTEASVEEGIVEEKPSEESTVELVSDAAVEELPEVESPTEAPIEEGIVEEEPSEESILELSTEEVVESEASVEETPTEESGAVSSLSTAALPEIMEGDLRLHFDELPEGDPSSMGLWLWGDVQTPSEELGGWPNGATNLSELSESEYGYYLDIAPKENAQLINYLINTVTGGNVTEDQTIQIAHSDMNQVWFDKEFNQYLYEPLENENQIRINYERKDDNYEGWGLWVWGEVDEDSENIGSWPAGAVDFKVGKYGAYVDIPLSNGLDSKLEFLLINQNNPDLAGNKSIDFAFTDRKRHSQIFLRNGDDKVYTNPYFIEEKVELDTSKATPGTKNVTIEASINAPFNYNESGLVSVAITNPESAEIIKMEVDTTTLGGGIVPISTELNRVTIKATSDTAPGTYSLPVKVYDKDNGYYETKLDVTITERIKAEGEKDWDEQVIYFMMTDRFYNGDVSNDQVVVGDVTNPRGLYQGGDFKGVTAKLDYLKELGVDSIWLTPIVENIPQNVGSATDGEYYAYHGYWAKSFEELNPHLGSLADFHELIDAAAEKGINIIVDVVLNHAGYGAEETFEGMVRTEEEDKQGDDQLGSLSGLPDFKTEEATVRNQLVAWQASWLERSTTAKGNSIYGFRVDTVKHVDDTTWQHFKNELVDRDPDFHLIGESWGANYKDTKGDLGIGTMDSLLDFGFKDIAKYLVNGQLKAAGKELEERSKVLTSAASLGQFLGSHDEDGFLYSLGGAEKEGNLDKLKLAASLLITAKGQPVIYYGEELGQSGQNKWPAYDNRYDFDWSKVETSDIEDHYQKLLAFRNGNSTLLSRGDTTTLAGNDSQGWLISKRSYQDQAAYLVFSTNTESKEMAIEVSGKDVVVTDAYTGKSYQAIEKDGKWVVQVELPTIGQGGTMLLQTEAGDIVNASFRGSDDAEEESEEGVDEESSIDLDESDEDEIPEDETQQSGGSDDAEEESEEGVDEESSIDLDESDEDEIPEDETQQSGGSDDAEEESEEGVDEESSIDLENTDVDQSSVGLLPATGEDKQYAIFSVAALAVLSGVGLIASTRKRKK